MRTYLLKRFQRYTCSTEINGGGTGAPMYHLPGNVISATVGLVCIILSPEYELPSSTRLGQFRKLGKIGVGAPSSQPPLRKQFLYVVWVLVRAYLHFRFDLLSSINFRDPCICGFTKFRAHNPYYGHPRWSWVVLLDCTDNYDFLLVINCTRGAEAVSCTVSEIQPSTCATSLYLATPLAFYPRRSCSPRTIFVKFSTLVIGRLGYKMALPKISTGWVSARSLQTTDRRTELRRQIPERNVVTFGYKPFFRLHCSNLCFGFQKHQLGLSFRATCMFVVCTHVSK